MQIGDQTIPIAFGVGIHRAYQIADGAIFSVIAPPPHYAADFCERLDSGFDPANPVAVRRFLPTSLTHLFLCDKCSNFIRFCGDQFVQVNAMFRLCQKALCAGNC